MDVNTPKLGVVIMCHNTPERTKETYDKLCGRFPSIEVFDSGSDPDKRPKCPHERFPNLYWSGCWREAMARHKDDDFLWVIGGDVAMMSGGEEYVREMRLMCRIGAGCWSPSIHGRCRGLMQARYAQRHLISCWQLEGQAMALSRAVREAIGHDIPHGNMIGWGVDAWMSWKSIGLGLRNVLDGRVFMGHEGGPGYDVEQARREFNEFLRREIGEDYMVKARLTPALDNFTANIRCGLDGCR